MTHPNPTDPPNSRENPPHSDAQPHPGTQTPPDTQRPSQAHTALPSHKTESPGEQEPGPLVVARSEGKIRLRDGRIVILENTIPMPQGHPAPRCQAIASRFDADPTGGAAGQCTHAAVKGMRVCLSHGANAPQSVAAARRRLGEAAPDAAARLIGYALTHDMDAETLRALDSVLDRAGLGRRSELAVSQEQTRTGLGERLDALELDAAESPGEGTVVDAGRSSEPGSVETVDAEPRVEAAGPDAPAGSGETPDSPGSAP